MIEALWGGLPCVCSAIPALLEHAGGGGCVTLPGEDIAAWTDGLRRLLTDEAWVGELTRAALDRPLPTWRESAEAVVSALK